MLFRVVSMRLPLLKKPSTVRFFIHPLRRDSHAKVFRSLRRVPKGSESRLSAPQGHLFHCVRSAFLLRRGVHRTPAPFGIRKLCVVLFGYYFQLRPVNLWSEKIATHICGSRDSCPLRGPGRGTLAAGGYPLEEIE